ncbi:response regulator transcription factor [Georgenia satyanarayanai]|uniref:response regulator transcription factor n=1 Tax=Georgenia satyanarayanai TaxID=860221 RepID=UPI00203CF12F|nr:response regulator transcription factor [Georgenia satyanarayanai]MCM3661614.1 response regulator transcription factor [Georgenia satyanarayanai]
MSETGARGNAVVIEDDADIRFLLEVTLGQAGFEVTSAPNGQAGVDAVRELQPVITTLDISLPDFDGFEVARRIRAFSDTYILMLTGRADEIDTLLGLEAGADDYVTKPFRPREIRARIEALLRRPRTVAGEAPPAAAAAALPAAPPAAAEATQDDDALLVHGDLRLDRDARLVELGGTPLELTRSEFDILTALLSNPRRVLSKSQLAGVLWSEGYDTGLEATDADRRSVEVHVANLRRKLGEDATSPRYVETVRGVGYRLALSAR